MPQILVTIKKADGTFAKVSLSEFKKMQAGQKPPAPAMPSKPATHHQPVQYHAPAHHATKHHPVHLKEEKKEHHPMPHRPKQMTRADAGSPLEEKLKVKSSAPLFSPKREKQVEEVLGKLGFSVAPEVLGRLKSLVLAKLKDIKSEEETRELLARSIKNGGLGVTEQQVEKIIKSCREVEDEENTEHTNVPVLKGKTNMLLMVEPPELPMVVSASPPFQGGVRGGLLSSASANASATPFTSPLGKGGMTTAIEPMFKLDTRPAMKQSMQDVTASSTEMGPVEEIKSMTLTDFRRLSGNPEEAAKRFQQKMFNLQEESFVWYLDALAAYHGSPLYREYMQAVCQSLAERKSLANVLTTKNSIKLNEAMALIEMEKGL